MILDKQFIFIIFPNEIDEISNEIKRCPVLYESGRDDGHFFKSLPHPIHQGIDKKGNSSLKLFSITLGFIIIKT